MALTKNRPCELGAAVGENLAKFSDAAEKECAEKLGFVAVKCATCAFKKGSVPNQCLTTVADAMKCSIENEPFYCHYNMKDGQPTHLCAGWLMLNRSSTVEMPWDYAA